MNNKLEIRNIKTFNLFIGELDCSDFSYYQKPIIKYLYNKTNYSFGEIISNQGGWQQNKYELIYDKEFQEYFNYLKIKIQVLISKMLNIKSFEVVQAWGNINGKYNSNITHSHPGCDLAACFYIKCPKNCGNLVINNPNLVYNTKIFKYYKKEFNPGYDISIKPKEGKLIIFPANFKHYVEPNLSDDYRISIAFNIIIHPNQNS